MLSNVELNLWDGSFTRTSASIVDAFRIYRIILNFSFFGSSASETQKKFGYDFLDLRWVGLSLRPPPTKAPVGEPPVTYDPHETPGPPRGQAAMPEEPERHVGGRITIGDMRQQNKMQKLEWRAFFSLSPLCPENVAGMSAYHNRILYVFICC